MLEIPMKKLLLGAAAFVALSARALAADMAVPYTKAPAMAVAPVYNWTGWYVGGNAGALWGNGGADPNGFTTADGFVDFPTRIAGGQFPGYRFRDAAFIGGGQFGYNAQMASIVYGIEADFQFTSRDFTQTVAFPAGAFDANTQSARSKLDFLGTVRGRIGYTFTPMFLGYVTGGLAYGHTQNSVTTIGVPDGFAGVAISGTGDAWRAGWTVGAGFEYAFGANWSVKGEYLYYDLGSQNVTLNYSALDAGVANLINYRFNNTGNIARVGLNYKFAGY
jgi:outer membrane immunogenic protein